MWTAVNSEYKFMVIPKNFILNNSLFFISASNNDIYNLCGILNSKLYIFYLNLYLGEKTYQYGAKDIFNNIPVKYMTDNIISSKVKNILKSFEIDKLIEIDTHVYNLYALNNQEIKFIDNAINKFIKTNI